MNWETSETYEHMEYQVVMQVATQTLNTVPSGGLAGFATPRTLLTNIT